MKKIVAIALLLVLALGICSEAFAAYPTAKLSSDTKYLTIPYYGYGVWKIKVDSKSYKSRTDSQTYKKVYCAAFRVYTQNGSRTEYSYGTGLHEFSGKGTIKYSFYPARSGIISRPPSGWAYVLKVKIENYHRLIIGSYYYDYIRDKTRSYKFRVSY